MVNKVILVGNLGKDPELKTVGSSSVCNFTIATSEAYTDKDGKKVETTEWHKINAWGKIGENCAKFLGKGSKVYVEGKIQTRSWDDKDGTKKYSTEITADKVSFLDSKKDAGSTAPAATASTNKTAPATATANVSSNDDNDDLPF